MSVNASISKTYIFSNKKLTGVAVLGVLLGMSIYIFMNSMMVGFDKSSTESIFKSTSHIRVYQEDVISQPLDSIDGIYSIISNPKIVPKKNTIINPQKLIQFIQSEPEVAIVTAEVKSNIFYNIGQTQLPGYALGIHPEKANLLYNIESTIVEGSIQKLESNPNAIIIGSGIADKMNLRTDDIININSSKGVQRNFRIVGIFKSNNSMIDDTKSFININAAQQLLKEGPAYITDINVNLKNPDEVDVMSKKLSLITGYKAESWKEANETATAGNKMRKIIITFVSLTILLVAGFGIYTILNMTVSQKINDIAILKAMGFKGKDVIKIFVSQAITIGENGVVGGWLKATFIITVLKNVYIGGDIGYFPIDYEVTKFIQGAIIGLVITFFAGYVPARKAANVDPVDIFRT
jgi:lipoprotein-releasing system permease protein